MRTSTVNIGLVSTAVLLTLAPAAQAFPQWMKPQDAESNNAPRRYSVYEPPPAQYGGYYTYAGFGPQPTLTSSSSSSISLASSEASGEETSLSSVVPSGKLLSRHGKIKCSLLVF